MVPHALPEPRHLRELQRPGDRSDRAPVLPLDLRIGRKITDDLVLSLEVGAPIVNDYPVYDFKTQLRMNLTF